MKTILAATLTAATLFAGAALASETTHDGTQVRAATALPPQTGAAAGFGGVSFHGSAGMNAAVPAPNVADPARNAGNGN